MLHEHAITYRDRLSVPELEYIIKKSNRLMRVGREVIGISEETDSEGTHVYFDVTNMLGKR